MEDAHKRALFGMWVWLTGKRSLHRDVEGLGEVPSHEGGGVKVVRHVKSDEARVRGHAHQLTAVVAGENGHHDVEEVE